jgi:hypothetical protein
MIRPIGYGTFRTGGKFCNFPSSHSLGEANVMGAFFGVTLFFLNLIVL